MSDQKRGVSITIEHKIRPEAAKQYEAWLPHIINAAASFHGHQGVNILKHYPANHRYTISVRYASREHAEDWLASDTRANLIEQASPYLDGDEIRVMKTGIDNWFEVPSPTAPRPVRWKQWLLTTLVITALTMIIPPLLAPLFIQLPILGLWGVSHVITAAVIVYLVVYVVMPRLVALTSKWLFAH